MYCDKCGCKLSGNEKFCPKCGEKIEDNRKKGETNKCKKKTRIVFLSFFVFAVILTLSLVFVKRAKEEELAKRYDEEIKIADEYFEKQDFVNAEKEYHSANMLNEKEEKPYLKLAQIYAYQNKINRAIGVLKQGVECSGTSNIDDK